MIKFAKIFRILSIDIALGACATSSSICYLYGIDIPINSILALGISIWLIYTCDHLMDANRIKKSATSERHHFHQKHFNLLLYIELFFFILAVFLALFFVDNRIRTNGFILIIISSIYLILERFLGSNKNIFFMKEFVIAIIYSLGLILVPFTLGIERYNTNLAFMFAELFLIAFSNLILFATFDKDSDANDNLVSAVSKLGIDKIKLLMNLNFVSFISIWFLSLFMVDLIPKFILMQIFFLTMMIIVSFIFFYKKNLDNIFFYKIIADGVFFLPTIIFLF